MSDITKLVFSLKDNILGEQISPTNTTIPLLTEFTEQVGSFLKGSKRIDLSQTKLCLSEGSLVLTAYNNLAGNLNSAISDYARVAEYRSIEDIDPVRAKVIEEWQKAAKENEFRAYTLGTDGSSDKDFFISIDGTTNYFAQRNIWVDVEVYLYGTIYDLGGKHKSNVHLQLKNGRTVTAEASTAFLSQDNENRLYKDQLVRVKAKQNIFTSALKDEKLVSFEAYAPKFDEEEFNNMVDRSTEAWSSVSDPTAWVEQLRGNDDI